VFTGFTDTAVNVTIARLIAPQRSSLDHRLVTVYSRRATQYIAKGLQVLLLSGVWRLESRRRPLARGMDDQRWHIVSLGHT